MAASDRQHRSRRSGRNASKGGGGSSGNVASATQQHNTASPTQVDKFVYTEGGGSASAAASRKSKLLIHDGGQQQEVDSTITNDNKMDILTEGQHYLSISMLVYMYSHLRETCRMGHTRVAFEELDVNSFQSLYGQNISPEKEGGERSLAEQLVVAKSRLSLGSRRTKYLDKTKSSGDIVRMLIDELGEENEEETGISSKDQRQELMGNSANREYEKSMMKEFSKWIQDSKVSQLDAGTKEVINNLRRQVAKKRWKRAKNMITIGRILSQQFSNSSLQQQQQSDDNISISSEVNEEYLSPNTTQMIHYLRRRVARYRWKRAISRVIVGIRLSRPGAYPSWDINRHSSSSSSNPNGNNIFVDWKRLMGQAVLEQPKFFRHGSVMNNLIESGIEVVWFSDLTQNDAVYGICCQRTEKRVTVVFRDTVNSHNWMINMKCATNEIQNPISEEYAGREDLLDIHTGFSLYMLRRRKDMKMNKIEEIFQKVDAIGREMCPDGNYKLSITGHSIGGALATLLGFYMAASTKFANVKQVRVCTFAAPRVGTTSFRNAYQHMERVGKIRHARFSCTHDIVPVLPFCNFEGFFKPWKWKCYKHVGIRVQLHSVGRVAKWRLLRRALDVTYPLFDDWMSEIRRMFMNSIFANLTTLKGFKRNHTLTEHQKRLHFASQYRLALGKSIFFHDQRRNRIKTLDEYYCFRAKIETDGVSMVDAIATSPRDSHKKRNQWKVLVLLVVVALLSSWFILVMAVVESFSNGAAKVQSQSSGSREYTTSFGPSALGVPSDSQQSMSTTDAPDEENGSNDSSLPLDETSQLRAAESNLKPLQEYATSVTFAPVLDAGLYLVGAGVRKKSIIKVYAVAMYSSPAVLNAVSSAALETAARTFNFSSPVTSFVLEMVYGVGAEKIAGAIAESVKPRYNGMPSDINALESLIINGVNKIGGQAIKGTTFRFDCSEEGVSVAVDGAVQGMASFDGLGSAFVDVFMDTNSVSPTLFQSCLDTWSSEEAKALAESLLEFSLAAIATENVEETVQENILLEEDSKTKMIAIESTMKPVQEYATGITFAPLLAEGLYLVGAGVRKKSIIKIYAVAMYSSAAVLNAVSPTALGNVARSFGQSTPATAFILEMVYSVDAEKIAGAIAESVKPRYNGMPSDINALESLIINGVNRIGGQAVKGTTFRFDCSEEGVSVAVDGAAQGMASFDGLGSAFVDVFMDANSVSPTLFQSCLDTWSSEEAKALAESLFELSGHLTSSIPKIEDQEIDRASATQEAATKRQAIESKLTPLQEYFTSVTFAPLLEEGVYLVGAGVRKKSIIKVYAVAIYSSPAVLNAVSSATLGSAARTFTSSVPSTSFLLEMVYSVGADKIAGAIAESVKPRYNGMPSDINALESLIIKGVNRIGGQAIKGTTFRFDCSEEGVSVAVDGAAQGIASFDGLGSAFVDVFMDANSVSPTLFQSCLDTWSSEEAKALAESLLEFYEEGGVEKSEETLMTKESREEERRGLDAIAVYGSNVGTDVEHNQEQKQLPSISADNSPPTEVELSSCGSICRGYSINSNINPIAKSRARDSFTRQQESIWDTVQSVQKNGSIQSKASDRAAQRLHILASRIADDG